MSELISNLMSLIIMINVFNRFKLNFFKTYNFSFFNLTLFLFLI